jgi:hypothetical protein
MILTQLAQPVHGLFMDADDLASPLCADLTRYRHGLRADRERAIRIRGLDRFE